jgi:molybdopterin molybdotransferase
MRTRISLEEAVALLTEGVRPYGLELLPLEQAHGHILAAGVDAPHDQPPFDRSPLDGYALRSEDTRSACHDSPVSLTVIDTVYAGDCADIPVTPGTAVRIMTGAMLPEGCDCVIRQEDTKEENGMVSLCQKMKHHENYCFRGEDYRAGELLVLAGTKINAAVMGVLASAGIRSVSVYRKPRVGLLVTGDELWDSEQEHELLPAGKIFGSNKALLGARLKELGMDCVAAVQVGDDVPAVVSELKRLSEQCDLLITTGGVSVGDKDIFHDALPSLGAEQIFWRVLIQPGTPAMFSKYQNTPILSLSGNPFAAAATFELLARPLLAALSGDESVLTVRTEGVLAQDFLKKSKSRRFIRATLQNGQISLPSGHSSGQLASMIGCNCLVDIPAGNEGLYRGEKAGILLI